MSQRSSKRTPKTGRFLKSVKTNTGFQLRPGKKVDVLANDGHFYAAKVKHVYGDCVSIGYEGWDSEEDESVSLSDGHRFAPHRSKYPGHKGDSDGISVIPAPPTTATRIVEQKPTPAPTETLTTRPPATANKKRRRGPPGPKPKVATNRAAKRRKIKTTHRLTPCTGTPQEIDTQIPHRLPRVPHNLEKQRETSTPPTNTRRALIPTHPQQVQQHHAATPHNKNPQAMPTDPLNMRVSQGGAIRLPCHPRSLVRQSQASSTPSQQLAPQPCELTHDGTDGGESFDELAEPRMLLRAARQKNMKKNRRNKNEPPQKIDSEPKRKQYALKRARHAHKQLLRLYEKTECSGAQITVLPNGEIDFRATGILANGPRDRITRLLQDLIGDGLHAQAEALAARTTHDLRSLLKSEYIQASRGAQLKWKSTGDPFTARVWRNNSGRFDVSKYPEGVQKRDPSRLSKEEVIKVLTSGFIKK